MKKALLFGATGFIGEHILANLLKDPDYDQVTIVVRRDPGIDNPKLKTIIGEFTTLPQQKDLLVGDDVFIALGTTRRKSPEPADYFQLDHDYPLRAARMALNNGASTVLLVTAIGADPNSRVFYIRTKGLVEEAMIELNYPFTHIFRPSLLLGKRKERRLLEIFVIAFWPLVEWMLVGKLRKYRGIDGEEVAAAMIKAAKKKDRKVNFYQYSEMKALLAD